MLSFKKEINGEKGEAFAILKKIKNNKGKGKYSNQMTKIKLYFHTIPVFKFLSEEEKETIRNNCFLDFETDNYELVPYFGNKWRGAYYISGPSRVGKSTLAGMMMKQYKKQFPKNRVVIFSPKENDPAFDQRILTYAPLTTENFVEPSTKYEMVDLEDSLCVFDDIEGVSDRDIQRAVNKLRNEVLLLGGSKHISCITITHVIKGGNETKIPITESPYVCIFPGVMKAQYRSFAKDYIGLSNHKKNNQIKDLVDYPSRWAIVHKNNPLFVFGQRTANVIRDKGVNYLDDL